MFSRTNDRISRRIAVHQNAGSESVCIEPLVRALIGDAELLSGQSRAFIDTVIVLAVEAFLDVEWASGGQSDDALERPAGCEHAPDPIPILGERNVPDVPKHQKMSLVEQAAGPLGLDVSGVLALATAVVRGIGGIIDEVGIGVRSS